MVWPFTSRSASSAASFEKSLSQLSTRITHLSSTRQTLQTSSRRFKALWTLYAGFAYILILAILLLVTGQPSWEWPEYTAVTTSPLVIYGVRKGVSAYYAWRIARCEARLKDAEKQRASVIDKLKKATKYDSTQQLLDKYGGAPKPEQQSGRPKSPKRKGSRQSLPAPGPRTGFAPPPTANIPSRQPLPPPQNPLNAANNPSPPPPPPPTAPSESFAPNAFPTPFPPAPPQPAWYDRILDLVLGEDETSTKNRFVLICARCRLVNGQAPPGARSLEDVGLWKCRDCGTENGVVGEVGKVLEMARGRGVEVGGEGRSGTSDEAEAEEDSPEPEEAERETLEAPPASSTKSRARQRRTEE